MPPTTKPTRGLGAKFMRLWQASFSSFLADGVMVACGPLLAATLTRDPLLIAGLVTAQRLPWLLFSLPSGAIVDRADRKRIMWVGNAFRAGLIAALALATYLHLLNIYIMYAFFFLLGTVEPFFDNASFALLPRLVETRQLEKANSRLFASLTVGADFLGPPLGSLLFAFFPPLSFLLSGFAYSGSSAFMASLPGQYFPRKAPAPLNRMLAEIKEGFKWFWSNSVLRTLAFLVTLQNVVWTGCYSLLVLYAQDRLGLTDVGYGFLISAGAVGGLLGSLTAEYGGKRFGTGRIVFSMVALTSAAFIVMGITDKTPLVMAMLAVNSFAISHATTLILALRQSLVPDDLLGRVTSVYRFIAIGAAPLGSLTAGLLARSFSLTTPYWTGGIIILVAALVAYPYINNKAILLARQQVPSNKS
jgi:predicted MFS family arabinose efflux permease